MATLTNNTIASTYTGLLSVDGAISTGAVEVVEDGAGTDTSLWLSNERCKIKLGTGSSDDFTVNDGSNDILKVEGDTKDVTLLDDLILISDSSVIKMGAGADATFTHDGTTGLTIAATPISINSTGDLTLDSSTDIVIDAAGGNIEFKDAGTTQLTLDMDGTGGAQVITLGVDGDDLAFNQYDGTEVMRITDNARVGIGTSTPVNTLHVAHNIADGDNGIMIVNEQTTITDGELLGAIGFDGADGNIPSSCLEASCFIAAYAAEAHATTDKGGDLAFGCSLIDENDDVVSTEHMRILDSGNVGIGVAVPTSRLSIAGSTGFVKINSTASNNSGIQLAQGSTEGTVLWQIYNNQSDSKLYIVDASGDGAIMTQNETSAWDWSSDVNLKTDISVISDALTKVNKIRGVNYKWKKYKEGAPNINPNVFTTDEKWEEKRKAKDINRVGVIAQEVNDVFPEAVNTDTDGDWMVGYTLLLPLLIEAVKELSVSNDDLKARIEVLEAA